MLPYFLVLFQFLQRLYQFLYGIDRFLKGLLLVVGEGDLDNLLYTVTFLSIKKLLSGCPLLNYPQTLYSNENENGLH